MDIIISSVFVLAAEAADLHKNFLLNSLLQ